MTATRVSPARRRADIQARWSDHLQAQRMSGQTQAAYCRSKGLDPKYFSVWKCKLRADHGRAARDTVPRLVPVLIRSERAPSVPVSCESSSMDCAVPIRLNLGNGMGVSLELAVSALAALVRELASVRC